MQQSRSPLFIQHLQGPGAALGPGDRAKNRNPCPYGAQAKESTYLMVSSAVEKNEAGKGMQDRISSDVLNHVVRESLHVKATRVQCARPDTWGGASPMEGRTRQCPEGGGGLSEQLGAQGGLSRGVRVEEARRSPEVIESPSTV